jgi:hypothetical protein
MVQQLELKSTRQPITSLGDCARFHLASPWGELAMDSTTACNALNKGLCLEVHYDGYARVVEVHAVGLTKDDNEIMRVWQVSGGSVSRNPTNWRLMRLDETQFVRITNNKSEAPRPGYGRDDKAIDRIVCQV